MSPLRRHECASACEAREALGLEVVSRDRRNWELVDLDGARERRRIDRCPFCGIQLRPREMA